MSKRDKDHVQWYVAVDHRLPNGQRMLMAALRGGVIDRDLAERQLREVQPEWPHAYVAEIRGVDGALPMIEPAYVDPSTALAPMGPRR